jgi:hypothetical protein
MYGYLWAVGLGTILVTGVLSYAMTRRYGWGAALAFPLLALAAVIAAQWQGERLGVAEGVRMAGVSLLYSAPVLLGALVGIAVARLRRG